MELIPVKGDVSIPMYKKYTQQKLFSNNKNIFLYLILRVNLLR